MRVEVDLKRLRFHAKIKPRFDIGCWQPPEALRHPPGEPVLAGNRWAGRVGIGLFLLLNFVLAGPLVAAQDDGKILREQARIFWEARIKGDWATVYNFLPETQRAALSREQYVENSNKSGPFRYLSYKMGEVEVADDIGWVKVQFVTEAVRFPGLPARTTERWDVWEKLGGKWFEAPYERFQDLPKLPPSQRPLKEEKAVSARADEFWKAREKNDYATVYKFIAPAFREKVSLEEFMGKKAHNIYVDHEVIWAEVQQDKATVRVTVEFKPNDPHLTKMDPEQQTIMQNWVKIDGQWYVHVDL